MKFHQQRMKVELNVDDQVSIEVLLCQHWLARCSPRCCLVLTFVGGMSAITMGGLFPVPGHRYS